MIKNAIFILFLAGSVLTSCKKEETTTPPPTTTTAAANLHVTIYEQLNTGQTVAQSKGKMQLYKTLADFNAQTNAVADIVADDAGTYMFTNLEPINYLFHAESADGTKNNDKSGNQTGVLVNNQTKELSVIVK